VEMQENNEIPLTQKAYHNDEAEGVYTQKTAVPAPSQIPLDTGSAMQLYEKYVELALRRADYETQREILFLEEQSVKETPFVVQVVKDVNPILRQDFVLQA
ncbi:unnamed protein product, partial [Adineta ricciae]